jgi:hypothetical protein
MIPWSWLSPNTIFWGLCPSHFTILASFSSSYFFFLPFFFFSPFSISYGQPYFIFLPAYPTSCISKCFTVIILGANMLNQQPMKEVQAERTLRREFWGGGSTVENTEWGHCCRGEASSTTQQQGRTGRGGPSNEFSFGEKKPDCHKWYELAPR